MRSNIFAGTFGGGIFLSANNGSTWTTLSDGISERGMIVQTLKISGGNIFAGTLDGVFLSPNNGISWTSMINGLSGDGLYVQALALSSNNIFAGTGRGVYLSTNNGTTWTAENCEFSDYVNTDSYSGAPSSQGLIETGYLFN